MDKLEFFKELYYKETDRKNNIISSFSTPIGIISALVAGIFYSLTTFDFSFYLMLSLFFVGLVLWSVTMLFIAIYHLIKALSNFQNGFTYAYLSNADNLYNYYTQLKNYNLQHKIYDSSNEEFDEYILNELIQATALNQKNNDNKMHHKFLCSKYMTSSFLVLCVVTVPYGINFGIKKTKQKFQNVSINSTSKNKKNYILILP